MGCAGSSSAQVVNQFIWGNSGSVHIKSMKLILAYDPESQTIVVKIPSSRVTESEFSWKGRKCYLQDISITDYDLDKTYACPNTKAAFTITEYDQFKEITETDQLVESIKTAQKTNIDANQKNLLIKSLRKECKEFWDFTRDFWVKNKNIAEKTEIQHLGRDCVSYVIEKIHEPSKIQEFLYKKYNPSSFGKLKKDIKAKAVVEKSDARPHIIKSRKSVLIQISVGNRPLVEIEEEIRLMIFCWNDIPKLSDSALLKSEMMKMQSGVKLVMADMQKTIDLIL